MNVFLPVKQLQTFLMFYSHDYFCFNPSGGFSFAD